MILREGRPDNTKDRLPREVRTYDFLDSLEIKYGAGNAEIKIDDEGNIRLIEVGQRMSGDCIGTDLVKYSTGYDYVGMVIQIACGEAPDFTPIVEPFPVESVFILDQEDLDKFHYMQEHEPERIIRVVDLDLDLLNSATNSSTRAGCYVIRHVD